MSVFNEPTFWCATISSFCAAYTVINNVINKNRKLSIDITWIGFIGTTQSDISFTVYNPASINKSIKNIEILYGGRSFPVTYGKDVLISSKWENGQIIYGLSDKIPMNINPKRTDLLTVSFKFLPPNLVSSDELTFVFYVDNYKIVKTFSITEKLLNQDQLDQQLNQLLR